MRKDAARRIEEVRVQPVQAISVRRRMHSKASNYWRWPACGSPSHPLCNTGPPGQNPTKMRTAQHWRNSTGRRR